jgi:hypothetical protein
MRLSHRLIFLLIALLAIGTFIFGLLVLIRGLSH